MRDSKMKEALLKQRQKRYDYQEIALRKKSLRKLYQAIENHESKLYDAFIEDLGKSEFETYTSEIGYIKSSISFMLKHMDKALKVKNVKTPIYLFGNRSKVMKEPLGQVLIISSFNYPFQLLMEPLIGAITAGNVAVLKPSEYVPHINQVIRMIIEESFEANHVLVYEGDKEVTSELLQHKFDLIFFTGSEKVGRIVYESGAKTLTPVVLELGGKSPAVVYEDAQLDVIVERILWGKFMNAGQTCVAPDYVLVEESIKDQFLEKAYEKLDKMYPTMDDMGKIVSQAHLLRLKELLEASSIEYEVQDNTILKPLVVALDHFDVPLMKEEIFGPILPVLTFNTDPKHIIQKFPEPLAMYVFTQDIAKAKELIKLVPAGGAMINHTVLHLSNPYLPFGGRGHSGMGSYHGLYSIDTFSHSKAVMISSTRINHHLLYPPFKDKLKWIKKLLK